MRSKHLKRIKGRGPTTPVETLEPRVLLSVSMVKDINTLGWQVGVDPGQVGNPVEVGGTVFFSFDDGTSGAELWKSDGTPGGTHLVKDIAPGSSSSYPTGLVNIHGTLYFGGIGGALWKSDGTAEGTVLIRQTAPQWSGHAESMTWCDDAIYFVVDSGQLWRSDGTAAGTTLVASGFTRIGQLTDVGGTLYFGAAKGTDGGELWKSDGTTAGTVMVKDIRTGYNASSSPSHLTAVGDEIFFSANDGVNGAELWHSDGTPDGTVMVTDLYSGFLGSAPADLIDFGGALYFTAATPGGDRQLWRSDGTAVGTTVMQDANAGAAYSDAASLTVSNGTMFFTASGKSSGGHQLWKSDGTATGTVAVKGGWVSGGTPSKLTPAGGTLYFTATDTLGIELWKSDGTAAGTVMVEDLNPGAGSSFPSRLTSIGNKLFFTAGDGGYGLPFWITDGSAQGTAQVARFYAGSAPAQFVDADGTLFFTADDGVHGRELWKSDGTAAGTVLVKDLVPGRTSYGLSYLTAVGAKVYFAMDQSLWVSDGTADGTREVKVIRTGSNSAEISNLIAVGGRLYFTADDGLHGVELWTSDGTTDGTRLVKNITPESTTVPSGKGPFFFGVLGDTLLFAASDGVHGSELWKTDGTEAGTVLVRDIRPGAADGIPEPWYDPGYPTPNMVTVGGAVYFWGDDGVSGRELWRSDGSAAGTSNVLDLRTGSAGMSFDAMVTAGNRLYVLGFDGNGKGLWTTDGTADGTLLVRRFSPTEGALDYPTNLTAIGNRLYFTYNEGAGEELWTSDGTAAGTQMLKDVFPGRDNGMDFFSTQIVEGPGGKAYFTANDGVNGYSVWTSDGSPEGTVRVGDPYAGPGNANPSGYVLAGGRLYFTATDGRHGMELWRYGAPVAKAGGTYSVAQGSERVVLDGSGSAASDETLAYAWDLDGDGLFGETGADAARGDETGPTPAFLLAGLQPGAVTVRLRVTDAEGLSDTDSAVVNVVDVTPPTVLASSFDWQTRPASFSFTFSEDVGTSLSPASLSVKRVGTVDALQASSFAWDPTTLTATFSFDRPLGDGDYDAALLASGVRDTAGNALAVDLPCAFFVLAGDANHDRRVDFRDMVVLAQNYNTAGKTFGQGDFDYDGKVDFNDLVILAQRYNTSLPSATTLSARPAAVSSRPVPKARPRERVFSTTPVTRPVPASPKPARRRSR